MEGCLRLAAMRASRVNLSRAVGSMEWRILRPEYSFAFFRTASRYFHGERPPLADLEKGVPFFADAVDVQEGPRRPGSGNQSESRPVDDQAQHAGVMGFKAAAGPRGFASRRPPLLDDEDRLIGGRGDHRGFRGRGDRARVDDDEVI